MKRTLKKRNTGKIIGIIIAFIAMISGCIALYFLNEKEEYDDENKEIYERVQEDAKKPSNDDIEEFLIDWEALKDYNVVAWIKYGDYVDYPVVQGEDNSYYLNHAYDDTYNQAGAIFLNSNNTGDFTDKNSIIYGHNMSSGSMFGKFIAYLNQNEKIPRDIYLYLPDGTKHTYRTFSINQVLDGGIAYQYYFRTEEEYEEYQNEMLNSSAYDVGGIANPEKNILTLSTCSTIGSSQGKRVVILGIEKYVKQIQEPASWYKPLATGTDTENAKE